MALLLQHFQWREALVCLIICILCVCEHYRAHRWIGELLNVLSDINKIKIKTWGKNVSLPEHSRSQGLSASGYVVSCWHLAWENFVSQKGGILLTSRHQECFISILQSSKVVRICPTAGKGKLLVANPLELTPLPPPPLQKPPVHSP